MDIIFPDGGAKHPRNWACGNAVPGVGPEPGKGTYKHREAAETYGVRPCPTLSDETRASPKGKVLLTLAPWQSSTWRGLRLPLRKA